MARIRRNSNLGTREARRDLPIRDEPYYMTIESHLQLGYRKSSVGGTWFMRQDLGLKPPDEKHPAPWRDRKKQSLGIADDFRDANGLDVLDFGQAQRKAMERATHRVLKASGQLYTVADAAADWLEQQRIHGKSAADAEIKLKAYVIPKLGQMLVVELKRSDFEAWIAWALQRRRKGKMATEPMGGEALRKRQATVKRVWRAFHALLNYAAKRHGAPREAWAGLSVFRSSDSARQRWLSVKEATRLQNACSTEFRLLVRAALMTGARAGELLRITAGDFDARSKTLLTAESKSGRPRRIPLTRGGVELFHELTAGKLDKGLLFTRPDGSPWYRVAIGREMQGACQAAKISPPATFHTLRHTYASHLVQEGVPLLFVASALGHEDSRMVEEHYGHLAASHVAQMIRQKLPKFGSMPRGNVRAIGQRRGGR